MKQKIPPPARTARGVRSRGTTLFSPPGGALGACNGASRPALLIRSGGRLREQSSTGLPHRLAASAGSLEAGGPVFLPIQVFEVYTGAILREVCGFVKRRCEIRLRRRNFHGEGAPALFPLTKFDRTAIIEKLSPIILEISQRGWHFPWS